MVIYEIHRKMIAVLKEHPEWVLKDRNFANPAGGYDDLIMAVIDWKHKTTLWQADGPATPPIHHEGKLLYEAESVWKQAEGLCAHMKDAAIGRCVLAVRDVATEFGEASNRCIRIDDVEVHRPVGGDLRGPVVVHCDDASVVGVVTEGVPGCLPRECD